MPFRTRLAGTVTLVGTPDYGVDGAPPGYYRSVLVVRRADRAADWRDYLGRPLAINDGLSQSGWAAPQNMAAAEGARFTRVRVTGAHRASAHAVARGTADIAAIDAVTWRLFTRFLPDEAATLAVLAETEPTPGLPYITARPGLAPRLASAIGAAIDDLAAHRNDLAGLRGLVPIPEAAYLAVPTPAPLTEAETLR
jgi:ABC-type phosphate/phosphonate transport system substrate-binding protein